LQSSLEGQVSATQPYRTAAQVKGNKSPPAVPPKAAVPKLAIVLMCAGTRGDVQPFIALGLELQVCCTFLNPQSQDSMGTLWQLHGSHLCEKPGVSVAWLACVMHLTHNA